jgi:tRNA threonylcarbamoyl adenosine modification protein YeaZ
MILAYNTSLADLHIGLFSDGAEPLAEYHHIASSDDRGIHDRLLASSTSDLLNKISASAKDISAITFINGPGSFTGLRIGLAFAKGMAFGSGASLIPLLAHEVLLKVYETRNPISDTPIPILYPGYEKDSVYMSLTSSSEKIEYIKIQDLLKMNPSEVICTSELSDIPIPYHIASIDLETMAKISVPAIGHQEAASAADLEPFYGTDFKTGK